MSADARRLASIRLLALVIGALSVAVVAVSAYLRLDSAGLGCANWPACYGTILAGDPAPLHYGFARLLHRFVASAALVLTCVLVWRCLRPHPLRPAARYAVLLLLLMLALSALGFASADPRRAFVGFLNIVGGLGLVTFSWRVAMAANSASTKADPVARLSSSWLQRAGVFALTLAALLGAWIGATYSAAACVTAPDCAGVWLPPADSWGVLNPFFRPVAAPMPGDAGGTALHLLHRLFALVALILLGVVAAARLKSPVSGRAARVVLILLGVVFALGVASILSGLSLWLVVAHGVGAALLLASVATLLRHQSA